MSVYWIAVGLAVGAVGLVVIKFVEWVTFLQHEFKTPLPVTLLDPSSSQPVTPPSVFDPATKALSIIVPSYNEEERLGATLDETLSYLQRRRDKQGLQFTYEIIVVDDGSKDKTAQVALSYTRKYGFDAVRLLKVPANRGKGHAVRRGMLASRGEYLLVMDADGATRVSDLELLEAALARVLVEPGAVARGRGTSTSAATSSLAAAGGDALGSAFGSRCHLERAAMAKRSALRNFLTSGFHMLVMFVVGAAMRDTQCGFKLFTRRTAALLAANQRLQRWCFDVELLLVCQVLGMPVVEVLVQWTEMPGSKIRATSILSMALELGLLKAMYQILGLWPVLDAPTIPEWKAR